MNQRLKATTTRHRRRPPPWFRKKQLLVRRRRHPPQRRRQKTHNRRRKSLPPPLWRRRIRQPLLPPPPRKPNNPKKRIRRRRANRLLFILSLLVRIILSSLVLVEKERKKERCHFWSVEKKEGTGAAGKKNASSIDREAGESSRPSLLYASLTHSPGREASEALRGVESGLEGVAAGFFGGGLDAAVGVSRGFGGFRDALSVRDDGRRGNRRPDAAPRREAATEEVVVEGRAAAKAEGRGSEGRGSEGRAAEAGHGAEGRAAEGVAAAPSEGATPEEVVALEDASEEVELVEGPAGVLGSPRLGLRERRVGFVDELEPLGVPAFVGVLL
mmetsp:Transcript_34308/g.110174  ORF Transcript_34308/g.110174 Transcript_34308/m.110174 type:complete len:329 (+) Transcript_34308:1014-2000(+)